MPNRDPAPSTGNVPNGQGGRDGNDSARSKEDDKARPIPPVEAGSPATQGPSVAPDVKRDQGALALRKIQDLLKDDKFTPNVEKQLGMTRDEAEQFIKRFEKKEQPGTAGPARELKVKPGEEKVFDPTRKAPEFNSAATVSRSTNRPGSSIPQDNISGMNEGFKSTPPPEIRRQFRAYKESLSGSKVIAPSQGNPSPTR